MGRVIYTYALIKSLYEQGNDYIDTFWPFAIKAIPLNTFADCNSIQKTLKKNHGIGIPLHVIGTILTRARRKGYIEEKTNEKHYRLTDEGVKYLEKLESDRDVERRINALLEDLRQFFLQYELSLTIEQSNNLLTTFILNNIKPLIEFINPDTTNNSFDIQVHNAQTDLLIEYITTSENQKPEHYKTIEEMILGSIISVILYSPEPSDIQKIQSKKFKHLAVYLDTNFIFSMLEFHEPIINKASVELVNILKQFDFELKVFSFTVKEICRVIKGYIEESNCYPTSISVDTIYSKLKSKGWTAIDAKEFITDIEKILSNKGITIDFSADVDLKTFKPQNKDLREVILKYKPLQNELSQNHDLAAIEKIQEIRTKPIRYIERSQAIFLTSDLGLSKFNFVEMNHKDNGTVCEIILDKLLANILWLKDPTSEVPIKSIISAYSRNLFVKRQIWDKFYETLKQLKKEEKIDDNKISMLFYHKFIEDVLRGFDETDADKITQGFVLEKIEEAAKLSEEEIRKQKKFIQSLEEKLSKTLQEKDQKDREWLGKIELKEKEFLRHIKEKISETEQEKDKNWIEKLENIKHKKRVTAEKSAKRMIQTIRIAISILLATPFIICIKNGDWQMFNRLHSIASIILLIIGLTFSFIDFPGWWKKMEKKLSDKIYTKKIEELETILKEK